METAAVALTAWVGVLSVAAFVLAGVDKRRARRRRRRVPERVLLGAALAGGTPGLVAGMVTFRHKTRKTAFLVPLGLILAAQAAVLWLSWSST